MKLYEFEGKSLFRAMGIPTPEGRVATKVSEACAAAEEMGFPLVIKSQVLRGGRGKSGGIKFAETMTELERHVEELLSAGFSGESVKQILIEEKLAIAREFYMGITLDPRESLPLLIVSSEGGVDIEKVSKEMPERLAKEYLDPLKAYYLYHMIDIIKKTGISDGSVLSLAKVLFNLVHCYFACHAITTEINPLVLDKSGRVIAADSKVEIDDAGLSRVKQMDSIKREDATLDPLEWEARKSGVSYVSMGGGDIGLIAGGAGLGMASMDMIAAHGRKPANFLDLGGDATEEKTAAALSIVLKTPGVKGVLMNLFGGINNCEKMAKGIVRVVDEEKPNQVIVVKMRGHSQDEGWALLEDRDIPIVKFGTTGEAVILLNEKIRHKEL
ncbi:MAG: acetate--CoA ligase family protein [Deltaproteobacteria bacterium]|nr:acetate--CoA ligase family protein [Deltaproteobacteria bacterium]